MKLPTRFWPFVTLGMLYWLAVFPILTVLVTRFITKGTWPVMGGGSIIGWVFGGAFFATLMWLTRSRWQKES